MGFKCNKYIYNSDIKFLKEFLVKNGYAVKEDVNMLVKDICKHLLHIDLVNTMPVDKEYKHLSTMNVAIRKDIVDYTDIENTIQVLMDKGIEDRGDAEIILQAVGYTLLDTELFPQFWEVGRYEAEVENACEKGRISRDKRSQLLNGIRTKQLRDFQKKTDSNSENEEESLEDEEAQGLFAKIAAIVVIPWTILLFVGTIIHCIKGGQ